MKREEDPGIAWIREIRHQISAEFRHDPKKFGDHLRELEKKYADRLEPMTKAHYEETNEVALKK
ncbi:hypothetical protein BH10ACI3_BH10ACI3_02390 [soil metagenome]